LAETLIESPLVTTIKASDDRDSPWVVIRSKDAQQLQSQLQELENGTVFADIGRVAAVFQTQARLGAQLGAKGVDPHQATGAFEGVTAAATPLAAPATTPPAAATPPAAPAKKFPAFGAKAAATSPPAAAPPAAKREAAEPPAAAPAAGGFPQAPQWKKP